MAGYKHSSRWNFGDVVWHKSTKDKGLIVEIIIKPNSAASYAVCFEDSRNEDLCAEFELTDEMPVGIETNKEQ